MPEKTKQEPRASTADRNAFRDWIRYTKRLTLQEAK